MTELTTAQKPRIRAGAPTQQPKQPPKAAPAAAGPTPSDPPAPGPVSPSQLKQLTLVPRTDPQDEVDPMLGGILRWPRSHGSYSEKLFGKWLRDHLENVAKLMKMTVIEHAEGCISISLPLPNGKMAKTLFSCHVDTVDPYDSENAQLPKKSIVYDKVMGHLYLDKDIKTNNGFSLGADDGVGVWMMLKMITAGIPGSYVFHRGEERGCIGSRAMATKDKQWLAQHKIAIAFDRPGDYEIITHQGGKTRGASDTCATALMNQLNAAGTIKYELSDRGVYTDTFHYFGIIAECFNLGVGYTGQHTSSEDLNYEHACALLKELIKVDWENLPVERKPAPAYVYQAPSYHGQRGGYGYGSGIRYSGGYDPDHDDLLDRKQRQGRGKPQDRYDGLDDVQLHMGKAGGSSAFASFRQRQSSIDEAVEAVSDMTYDDLSELIDNDPMQLVFAIIGLQAELDAEKAKTRRFHTLMGA